MFNIQYSILTIKYELLNMKYKKKTMDADTSTLERQNAAAYISSFISRSAFLRHVSANVAFELLLEWAHTYTILQEDRYINIIIT